MFLRQTDSASLSASSDRSLLRRVRERDTAAWTRLSRVYGPLIYEWCRRVGTPPADAADVVQEVLVAVYRSLDGFQAENSTDSFRGWLWTITRNKLRDWHRREGAKPLAVGGSTANRQMQEVPEIAPEDSSESLRADVTAQLAQRAMCLLKSDFEETTWRAFWDLAVENKPAAQVSAELGISVAAAYVAKSRVLKRLREELAGLL